VAFEDHFVEVGGLFGIEAAQRLVALLDGEVVPASFEATVLGDPAGYAKSFAMRHRNTQRALALPLPAP